MKFETIEEISSSITKQCLSNIELARLQLNEIIEELPPEFSNLIESAFKTKRVPKEYLLSSILFAISNAAGLIFSIEALGYVNYANLYFAIIGHRGDVKSEAIKIATSVLTKCDSNSYSDGNTNELENIKKRKFLIQNATIQAALFSHYHNPCSTGICMDELTSLIEIMASKSSGDGIAWRTFLLEGYNNSVIDVLRRTSESYRIEKSYPTLIGSIQEEFIPSLFANGNLESGFTDRLLFTPKLTKNNKISSDKIPLEVVELYEESLYNIINYRENIENDPNSEGVRLVLEKEAEEMLVNYVQELVDKQQIEEPNVRDYLAKLQISIHKILIIVHLLENAKLCDLSKKVGCSQVKFAIKINEFYLTNFRIITEQNKLIDKKPLCINKIIESAITNNATQKDVVAVTGKSKATVSRKWNNILAMKLETKSL